MSSATGSETKGKSESTMHNLWTKVVDYGYKVRSTGLDGLAAWNHLKRQIPSIQVVWTQKSLEIYDQLAKLGVNTSENFKDAGMDKADWERHHYLLQHGRIVHNNRDGNLMRYLQIAYNVGQFKRELEKSLYPSDQLRYYIVNELNCAATYIADPCAPIDVKLDTSLPKPQKGAGRSETYFVESSHPNYLIDLRQLPDGFSICLPRGEPKDYMKYVCNPLTGYWLELGKKGFNQLLEMGLFVSFKKD